MCTRRNKGPAGEKKGENTLKRYDKGQRGFIHYKKKMYLFKTILYIVIGLAIFVTGLLLNKMSPRNIFSVLAMLMVLPGARALVGLIVLFPYKSVEEKRYETVSCLAGPSVHFMTDLVITSPDKVMNLDFIAETRGSVIGLLGKHGQDLSYIQNYLSKGVNNFGTSYKVRMFTEEEAFKKALKSLPDRDMDDKEEAAVLEYLNSLIVI